MQKGSSADAVVICGINETWPEEFQSCGLTLQGHSPTVIILKQQALESSCNSLASNLAKSRRGVMMLFSVIVCSTDLATQSHSQVYPIAVLHNQSAALKPASQSETKQARGPQKL